VSIDGRRVAVINLHSKSARCRQVVFAKQFAARGRHRLSVTVLGTAGPRRVDIDAFLTLRDGATAEGFRVAGRSGLRVLRRFVRRHGQTVR
jgi:hypothetical protein